MVLAGEQPAIVDWNLFDSVQAKLHEQNNNHTTARMTSEALLVGRIFDNRGNRMSPSHARKRGIKYRYYLSSALLQGLAAQAGSIDRVSATDIETLVAKSVRAHLDLAVPIGDRNLINTYVARVEVQPEQLIIQLVQAQKANHQSKRSDRALRVPWHKMPSTRRREILIPATTSIQGARPIRSETRTTLVASIARGRRWLDELITNPSTTTESIAERERCSARKINMTISLAFLAPNLVKAAIEGRLPHGMGLSVFAICQPNGPASTRY